MSASICFKQVNDISSVTTVIGNSTQRAYDRAHIGSRSENSVRFGDAMPRPEWLERRTPLGSRADRSADGLGAVFDGLGFSESEVDQGVERGGGFSTVHKPRKPFESLRRPDEGAVRKMISGIPERSGSRHGRREKCNGTKALSAGSACFRKTSKKSDAKRPVIFPFV
jgi:hypothetical protein